MRNSLKRHFLKENEIKQILDNFSGRLGIKPEQLFGSKPRIELVEAQEAKIFLFNNMPFSAQIRDMLFPTLLFEEIFSLLPKIVVDMGAVRHICNGADIMAPGVVKIEGEFDKNAFLLIVDERHGKPLAIGQALIESKIMKETKRGKIVKNVHHVGDDLWNLMKKIA